VNTKHKKKPAIKLALKGNEQTWELCRYLIKT